MKRLECGASGAASRAATGAATFTATCTKKCKWPCIWLHRLLHDMPSCVNGRGGHRAEWDAKGRTSSVSAGEQQKVGGGLDIRNYISAFPFLAAAGLRSANFGNF
jgi:hypothetical protein